MVIKHLTKANITRLLDNPRSVYIYEGGNPIYQKMDGKWYSLYYGRGRIVDPKAQRISKSSIVDMLVISDSYIEFKSKSKLLIGTLEKKQN